MAFSCQNLIDHFRVLNTRKVTGKRGCNDKYIVILYKRELEISLLQITPLNSGQIEGLSMNWANMLLLQGHLYYVCDTFVGLTGQYNVDARNTM